MRGLALLTGTILLLWASPCGAKTPWLKQAMNLGLAEIKDCKSCHGDKNTRDSLSGTGKWLVAQKVARKATECDVAWLKEREAPPK